jgi:hypothetical protein
MSIGFSEIVDQDTYLSSHFTLAELSRTDTRLPNQASPQDIENLRNFARRLDKIYDAIGPFYILSAFRSPSVNSAVGGVSSSQHLTGEAADIVPTSMSAKEYWGRILADENLRDEFGQIALKTSAIHISMPSWTHTGDAYVVVAGNYIRKSLNEVRNIVGSAFDSFSQISIPTPSVSRNQVVFGIVAVGLFGIAAWMLSRRRT